MTGTQEADDDVENPRSTEVGFRDRLTFGMSMKKIRDVSNEDKGITNRLTLGCHQTWLENPL